MTTTARVMTADELWSLPAGNLRRELIGGELRTMAPAGFDHGVVINRLAFLLTRHCDEQKLGVITGAETGFVLRRNPDTVRGADVAFVGTERVKAAGRTVKFWEGAPDLAVEVLSPSDTAEEVDEKVDEYLAAGAQLVWVVNPRRKTVTAHRSGHQPLVLREADRLDAGDVVTGFQCTIAEIFA